MASLPSPVEVNLPGRILARTGLASQIPGAALRLGEIAFTTDDYRFWVGDDSQSPPWILTSKYTGSIDWRGLNPTFNNINVSTINGQTLANFIASNNPNTSTGNSGSSGSSGTVADISTQITSNGIPTRFKTQSNNVRTACGGAGTLSYVTGITLSQITKIGPAAGSGATDLFCFVEVGAYGGNNNNAGPTYCRMTDGVGHSDSRAFSSTFWISGVGAISISYMATFRLSGVASGAVQLFFQLTRLDANSWYTVVNPDGTDFGYGSGHTGTGTLSNFTIFEIPSGS